MAASGSGGALNFGGSAIGEDFGVSGGGIGAGPGFGGSAMSASTTAQTGVSGDPMSGGEPVAPAAEAQGGSSMTGGMGMGGMGNMGGNGGKRRGRRAAYLVEDEETWTSGTNGVNPAVIE
ncbi:hypothetical protein GXW82_36930 [Streptacidiphilus sp. 4-A2]|nr:hypothetical protein [Streptacidiphilus sp. 4-A2]